MSEPEQLQPIILHVGKRRRRVVADLKRGRGRLMDHVEETLQDVRTGLGTAAEGKRLVPVIMIYRHKPKRRRARLFG